MSKRIKNLKFDPNYANKPMRGYSHLEFLDDKISIPEARKIQAYEESKYGRPKTLMILEPEKKKKEESND